MKDDGPRLQGDGGQGPGARASSRILPHHRPRCATCGTPLYVNETPLGRCHPCVSYHCVYISSAAHNRAHLRGEL